MTLAPKPRPRPVRTYRPPVVDMVELECLYCTLLFTMPDRVYREQEKAYCPKCARTSIARV